MADALAAAHAAGVIHRDFKSANVVLEPAEDGVRAVVTDFGLARTGKTTGKTIVGEIAGTPAYMAPEQLQGGATSPATDVYAFGVVMCEALTGHKPFSGDVSLASVLQRLRKGDISPDLRGAKLGRAWEPIVLKCLSQDPQERFADGRALMKALDEAAGESKPGKKWMWAAAAVALVLVAVAVPTLDEGEGRRVPRRIRRTRGIAALGRGPRVQESFGAARSGMALHGSGGNVVHGTGRGRPPAHDFRGDRLQGQA